ncbi:hypothetical protein [Parashewanella tropica]|uniref:hypothetical protein n=1 Tax=Parashewanella tropica TaxID=2547970 RepID=UPI001059BA5A|nr:hypothetical protein [Parashewanella tropica]
MSTGAVLGHPANPGIDLGNDKQSPAQAKKEQLESKFTDISQQQGLTESYKNAVRNDVYAALVAFEEKYHNKAIELLLIFGNDMRSVQSRRQAYEQLVELAKPAYCEHFKLEYFKSGSILLKVLHLEQVLDNVGGVEQATAQSIAKSVETSDWVTVGSVTAMDTEFEKIKADCLPLEKYFKQDQLRRVKWLLVQFANDTTPAYQRYNAYIELQTHLTDPRYVAEFSLQPLNQSHPSVNGAKMQIGQLVRIVEDRGAATLQQELLKYYQARGEAFIDEQFRGDLARSKYTFVDPNGDMTVLELGDDNTESKYERVEAREVSSSFQAGFKKMLACQAFEADVFRYFSYGFAQVHTARTKTFSIVSNQYQLFEFHIESMTPKERLEEGIDALEFMIADVKILLGPNEVTCFGQIYREGDLDPLYNMKSKQCAKPDDVGDLYFEDHPFSEELKLLSERDYEGYKREFYSVIDLPAKSSTQKRK